MVTESSYVWVRMLTCIIDMLTIVRVSPLISLFCLCKCCPQPIKMSAKSPKLQCSLVHHLEKLHWNEDCCPAQEWYHTQHKPYLKRSCPGIEAFGSRWWECQAASRHKLCYWWRAWKRTRWCLKWRQKARNQRDPLLSSRTRSGESKFNDKLLELFPNSDIFQPTFLGPAAWLRQTKPR